jgi:ferredoxin
MTPFGIRSRLRGLFGLDGVSPSKSDAPVRKSYQVTFECPDGSEFTTTAKEGDSLVLAAGRGPQPISTGCTDGTCGTCRVHILAGSESLTEVEGHETRTKADVGVPSDQRLGCHTGVLGSGVRVRIVNILGMETIDP